MSERRSHQRKKPRTSTGDLEERFGRILEQLGEGVVVSDSDELPVYVNQAMVDLLGYTREEFLEKRSFDLVPEEELELLQGELKKRRRGKTSRYNLTLVAKSGGRVPVQVAASPLPDGGTVAIVLHLCLQREGSGKKSEKGEQPRMEVREIKFPRGVSPQRLSLRRPAGGEA